MRIREVKLGLAIATVFILVLLGCAPASPAPALPPTPTRAAGITPVSQAPTIAPASVEEKPKYGGILTATHDSDPPGLDPHQVSTLATIKPVGPSYNNILQYDPLDQSKIIPDLAESWEIGADGRTYTFRFRRGIKWHDGMPFTSEDVRYNLDRIRKPPKGVISPRQATLAAIERMETPDENTLRITLSYPSASFLDNIAVPWHLMLPKHILEREGQDILKKKVVGTGPFKYKEYITGVSYEVVKNPDYFVPGRPYLDGVRFLIIRDLSATLAAVRTGQANFKPPSSLNPTPAQLAVIEKEMGKKVVVQKRGGWVYDQLVFNQRQAPWDDVRVRRAIGLSFDYQAAIQVILQGEGDMGAFMVPGGKWALTQEELLKTPGYRLPKDQDIAEAKKLLMEAGFSFDKKVVRMLSRNLASYEKMSVFALDQLSRLGIQGRLDMRETAAYYAALEKGEFDISPSLFGRVLDDPDYIYSADLITEAGRNYGAFSDRQFDELFQKQARTLDPAQRRELVSQMERRLLELAPRVVVAWERGLLLHWDRVKNYQIGAGNHFNNMYQDVWLAQ